MLLPMVCTDDANAADRLLTRLLLLLLLLSDKHERREFFFCFVFLVRVSLIREYAAAVCLSLLLI